MGEKDLVEAGVAELEGFDAPPRELALGEGEPAADTSRRQSWRGAVVLQYQNPWGLVLHYSRLACWSYAFMLTIMVAGLAVKFAWGKLLLPIPLTFLALGGLFHFLLRSVDSYLVADPAERALLEVTDVGPWRRIRRRWAQEDLGGLALRTEAGYHTSKDQHGAEVRHAYKDRTLVVVPAGGGEPVAITPGCTPGPGDRQAVAALAAVLGVPSQVLETESLGRVLAPTGGEEWGLAVGMTVGTFLPALAAAAVMAALY